MTYIDIFNELDIDDYYTTDTHWKQGNIGDVVNKIANSMEFSNYLESSYETVQKGDFYGVYYGQSALPLKPDTISYLTNEVIENAKVKVFDSKSMKMVDGKMYNEEKLSGNDSYDLFLDGAVPLITIENGNCKRDKELYIFRDSYGSSLTPLFTEAYRKITIIDLRYIATPLLKNFVEFNEGSDALFIYGVDVLNNSSILKVIWVRSFRKFIFSRVHWIRRETRDKYVVYRVLYWDTDLYVRPYDMFMAEVEHEKHLNILQKYRLESQNIKSVEKEEWIWLKIIK